MLVYDVNNFEGQKRLRTYWLPRIVKLKHNVPIIICGNKIDGRVKLLPSDSRSNSDGYEHLIESNFADFKQVEMCLECSAKEYFGLIDIISCAQKAVLFPAAPLHDKLSDQIRPDFEKALLRVFRICDKDGDGHLNDDEFREFQGMIFAQELQRNHITAFKEVLVAEGDDFDEAAALKGINF